MGSRDSAISYLLPQFGPTPAEPQPIGAPGDPNPAFDGAALYPVRMDGAGLMPQAHNTELALLMVERFLRADAALGDWSETAKRCVDFVENKQWSVEEIKAAEMEDRPLVTLNKLSPLLRLVLGYFRNNRIDNRYMPTSDAASIEATAEVLTKVAKAISMQTDEPYVDTEVALDGLVTGRGFYDWRLDFEKNDFGDARCRAKDPFTIRIDPDADSYDPDDWGYAFEARWVNLDEITFTYGRGVGSIIEPLVRSSGYRGGVPSDMLDYITERTPWRTFGGQQAGAWGFGSMSIQSYIANAVDPYRKNVRLVECQHRIRVMQRCVVDMSTGDRVPIPESFTPAQVAKVMQWAAEQYQSKGQPSPLRVQWRPVKRVRWTTMIGDIIVYDDWSPYQTFTQIPFFPYFRRGMTRGMIEDGIGPQQQINRHASAELDITERSAYSGWMWHKNALDEPEKEKIENFGGAPGLTIEWQGGQEGKPEQIRPPVPPEQLAKLQARNTADIKEIMGINDSALGQIDRVQSGRAIEARQKQSVLGLEMYSDNMRRTKKMSGRKKLELIQTKYTEPRLQRIQGPSGAWENIFINQPDAMGNILNNVTVGKYDCAIDETALSETFLNAQIEEIMTLVEKGILPIPMVQDIIVDLSTLPQKALVKARLSAYLKAMGIVTPDQIIAAQAAGQPIPQGALPAPQPHGVPGKQLPPHGTPGQSHEPAGGGGASGTPHGLPPSSAASGTHPAPALTGPAAQPGAHP